VSTQVLQSAVKALKVLEEVSRLGGSVGVGQLARHLGWQRGATHQYLVTLASAGWLRQDDSGGYRLSLKAGVVGRAAMTEDSLVEAIEPLMHDLVARIHESISLAILQDDATVVISRVEPGRLVRIDPRFEGRMSLEKSASGKVLVAHAAPDELAQLGARTQLPPTDELTRVRRDGYATARAHWYGDDIVVVAVPVLERGTCLAAVCISAPTARADLDEMIAAIRVTAEELDRLFVNPTPAKDPS